jgi:uncharacterized protein YyaL (SSP411 family)
VTAKKGRPQPRFRFSPRPNRAHEIRWHEWEPKAFERARREDKPILLSLSAVWCHWCHVMDETTYSDEAVIAEINEHYVPIRVDNDRRPDINLRYNMGGWPTTAFLTPDGDILTGATYLPPERMSPLLSQLAAHYQTNREEIDRRVQEAIQKRRAAPTARRGPLTEKIFEDVLLAVQDAYDPAHGGFGDAPKFPHSDAIALLLYAYQARRDPDLLHMARKTLESMADGGMFDHEWGGFFRYSTNRDWSVPHFEKMLEDNAALLGNYLLLYRLTGDEAFARVSQRVIEYLDGHLWDSRQGYFYGSQDADEHFYTALTAAQREGVPEPYIDPTCYTSWNALATSAHLEASWTLQRPELAEKALQALDFLWRHCHRDSQGMYRFYDEETHVAGILADQAYTALACLDAYEVTGRAQYLDRARELASFVLQRFADEAAGGFFDTWDQETSLGQLKERQKSPSDNAACARLFTRLHRLTGDETHQQAAQSTLEAFAAVYPALGHFAAAYAQAVHLFLSPYTHVNIVGDVDREETRALLRAALRLDHPSRAVQPLHPQRDSDRLHDLALPNQPSPAAYVCYGTVCSSPVTQPEELAETADSMRKRFAPNETLPKEDPSWRPSRS